MVMDLEVALIVVLLQTLKVHDHKGLQFTEFAYSVAGAYGEAAGKVENTVKQTGNTGNFNDRSYNRLSKNAKAHYNFTKNKDF